MTWQEYQSAHGYRMKRDIGQVKEEKAYTQAMPNPKKGWDGMQRMKAQRLIHAERVKRALAHAVKSGKPKGNGKCMKAKKVMDSYRSGACTQGSITTYLYSANTGEVGHKPEV